jgi:hypothetical protein
MTIRKSPEEHRRASEKALRDYQLAFYGYGGTGAMRKSMTTEGFHPDRKPAQPGASLAQRIFPYLPSASERKD